VGKRAGVKGSLYLYRLQVKGRVLEHKALAGRKKGENRSRRWPPLVESLRIKWVRIHNPDKHWIGGKENKKANSSYAQFK